MKEKKIYVCSNCGASSPSWQGKCSECGSWDTLTEQTVAPRGKKLNRIPAKRGKVTRLGDISSDAEFRMFTGISELDRVLGGGIIPGSLILIGGDPGIGKSTLMLQMCTGLSKYNPLYVTGEESLKQIKYRASRLQDIPDDLMLMAETSVEAIQGAINANDSDVIIIDSIQSIYTEKVDATPGSFAQVRECTSLLIQIAKQTGKAIFIVGHITKEGMIAGPKMLEHMVDTVLQFEGEKTYSYRILRAHKNRFGSTNEIGIFEMRNKGLSEIKNPSEIFLEQTHTGESGIAIVSAIEGSRPILLEVQALVSPTGYSMPQRTSTGYDSRRLQMILAVLEKRLGLQFRQQDVFVNIAGGMHLSDPAIDLGIAAALVSSLRDSPLSADTVMIGEIGLTGEIRPVSSLDQRVSEAHKLGFKNIFIPKSSLNKVVKRDDINISPVDRISLVFTQIF